MASEFWFILMTLFAFCLPLLALKMGKEWLIALLPITLITGNVFAQSFIIVFGSMTSLAIPVYATTFLVTDIISEYYGRKAALRAVWIGLTGQVFFLIVMLVVLNAPLIEGKASAYSSALSTIPKLVIGSFIAYIVSQNLDVRIFDTIRNMTGEKSLWLRNNVSTMISQAIDTIIFLLIAFWNVPPFTNFKSWAMFALVTWIFKVFTSALDTPYMYFAQKIAQKS